MHKLYRTLPPLFHHDAPRTIDPAKPPIRRRTTCIPTYSQTTLLNLLEPNMLECPGEISTLPSTCRPKPLSGTDKLPGDKPLLVRPGPIRTLLSN